MYFYYLYNVQIIYIYNFLILFTYVYEIRWAEGIVSLGLHYGEFKMCITK